MYYVTSVVICRMSEGVCEIYYTRPHDNRYSHLHFKSEMGLFSGYIYFFCLFQEHISLLYRRISWMCVGGSGDEGVQMNEPDMRRGVERGRKN